MINDNNKPVPLLDLHQQHASIREEVLKKITEVVDAQAFILGPEVEAFERELAGMTFSPHAVSCASGTDALILPLRALGVGSGDEVIVPVYTYFATAAAVMLTGAKPVFVDIEPEDFNIDPEKVEPRITGQTKVILPVHLYGRCARMDRLCQLAEDYNLHILEDAAQAVGATWQGKAAGTFGMAGALSFYPTKNLGGYGEGGMILTADDAMATKLRLLRSQGDAGNYQHVEIGTNSRLDALQAAVLRIKLRHLDEWNQKRREKAALYRELFKDTPLTFPPEREGSEHVYNLYVVRAPERDGLMAHLQDRQIGCRVYYPAPLHVQPCFNELGYKEGDFPVAEQASKESLALPMFPELSEAQQAQVAGAVKAFYGE